MRRAITFAALLPLAAACGDDDAGDRATDAAPAVDADVADASTPDGPPVTCPSTFAGCGAPLDLTGMPEVTITVDGEYYSPACIRVSAGTAISIAASDRHPLDAAPCSTDDFIGAPPGGLMAGGTFTIATPGAYGFYCPTHGTASGSGMAGLILVE